MSHDTPQPSKHRNERTKPNNNEHSKLLLCEPSPTLRSDSTVDIRENGGQDLDSADELSESSTEPSDHSSSDSESESESGEQEPNLAEHGGQNVIINLRANRGAKPNMKMDQEDLGPDIRHFLKDFLPQLKAANADLEERRKAGTLSTLDANEDDQEGQYIEMDLALGVLEAQSSNASESVESEDEEAKENKKCQEDVMGKLMGRKRSISTKPIEVIQSEKNT